MDMDLHLARVQERWRYADDELEPGAGLSIEALAYDPRQLPDLADASPDEIAEAMLDFFGGTRSGHGDIGGAIEAVADEDGVLIADPASIERAELT